MLGIAPRQVSECFRELGVNEHYTSVCICNCDTMLDVLYAQRRVLGAMQRKKETK